MTYDAWPDDVEHVWTQTDRVAQLADVQRLCRRMAELFAAHRDPRAAELMSAKAAHAARLLEHGFTRADLIELSGPFPEPVWWLNPKASDHDGPRSSWQEEVAELHRRAQEVVTDLRSVATLRRP